MRIAELFLLLKVGFAAMVGGFAAMAFLLLWYDDVDTPLLLVFVATVVVLAVLTVGVILAQLRPGPALAPPPRRPPPRTPPPSLPPTRPSTADTDGWAAPADGWLPTFPGSNPSLAATVSEDPTPPVTAPPTTVEHPVPGAPPRATPVRRIVQCPRCGDFAVDVRPGPTTVGFACRRCRHGWEWAPGRSWPITLVRPSLHGARHDVDHG
jgi:hypothetical protein